MVKRVVVSLIIAFRVIKGSSSYENWCKTILLSEKPGCYLSNVGHGFAGPHEELEDFVNNSTH